MSCNKLKEIHRDTFKDLKNLSTLFLSHNNLKELDKDVFNGLFNVTEIYLNNNQIEALNSDLFKNLAKLDRIELHQNRLSDKEDIELNLESSVTFLSLQNDDGLTNSIRKIKKKNL